MAQNVQMTWEDQQNINKFGRFHTRFKEIEQEIEMLTAEYDTMKDGLADIENLLDEDAVKVKIGEIYFEGSNDEGIALMEKCIQRKQDQIDELKNESQNLDSQLADLKKILYDKFGDSIRLE
jgi:prefoldin subunit 4